MQVQSDAVLKDDDKIWRISSLTAYVDDETKILLLPVPESKRKTKIMETFYSLKTVNDLFALKTRIEKQLTPSEESLEVKRYEDKTQEEISSDMQKKRKQQMNHMMKIRKYQLGAITAIGCFYLLVYRRFLHPKSIFNSVLYHNAMKHIENSNSVTKVLGNDLTMMNCAGSIYPLLSTCRFEMTLFGSK